MQKKSGLKAQITKKSPRTNNAVEEAQKFFALVRVLAKLPEDYNLPFWTPAEMKENLNLFQREHLKEMSVLLGVPMRRIASLYLDIGCHEASDFSREDYDSLFIRGEQLVRKHLKALFGVPKKQVPFKPGN